MKVSSWWLWLFFSVTTTLAAREWEWRAEAGVAWHDNVTNADRAHDRLSALQLHGGVRADAGAGLKLIQGLRAGWRFDFELWPRYEGLNAISGGPELSWRKKIGLGAHMPVLTVRATGTGSAFRDSTRSGSGGQFEVRLQKRLGTDGQVFAGVEWDAFRAESHAFNRDGRAFFLRGTWQVSPAWQVSLEGRVRSGDVVSYTSPPRPDLVQAGKVLTLIDTFKRESPLLAYYFPAETRGFTGELSRSLGRKTVLSFRFEYRDTRHNAVRYLNQISSVGVARRF